MTIATDILTRIEDVDADAYLALRSACNASAFYDPRLLGAVERSPLLPADKAFYLIAYDGPRLAGFVPLYLQSPAVVDPFGVLAQNTSARSVHKRVIVLDTHFDTPANLSRPGWNIMDRHDVAVDGTQVDYPRMVSGGVDGGFFAIFTPQGARGPEGDLKARDAALVRGLEIHEMVAANPKRFEIALTPDQALDIVRRRKRFVFISMENGNPFGKDLSLMKTFYAFGVRLMGPVHFLNNELGDSATDKPEWGGLSPLGKQFVAEANRMGIVLDASHSADTVLDDMLALSKAPIILRSGTGAQDGERDAAQDRDGSNH